MCKVPEERPIEQQAPMQEVEQFQVEEPLTAAMLEAASPQERDDMLCDRLFPRVLNMITNIWLAGKVIELLLELSNNQLLYLLEHDDALQEKVEEARVVLHSLHSQPPTSN